ncbi:MAG: MFS transporter [Planctomycetaceae bacterium]|nr:MFS transporter [Planctomycetaceae bacterium]
MLTDSPTASAANVSRGELWAWAMYDWANSAYSTLSITILNGYLLHVVFASDTWQRTGDVVWAWGIGASMFLAGLCSPVCGAWADARANKRGWLAGSALTGALAMIALAGTPVEYPWVITALFILAAFMFELSLAFYNGFLPELTDEHSINRVSAWGFGLGYIGGGLSLVVAMLLLQFGPAVGLDSLAAQLRAGLVLLGVWWAVFSLPAIMMLRDRAPPRVIGSSDQSIVVRSFRQVGSTLLHIRALPMLFLFLLGFLFYNDAVQTVISQASTFATRELSFTSAELAQVILMIQFVAFPGAMAVGRIADRWGAMRALWLCWILWGVLLVVAYFITTKLMFWCLGVVVALVMGGIQSVSRSVMSQLTPPDRAAEFMGFFNLSGKTTSFMGTFLFGLIVLQTGSARLAIVSLLGLLLVGVAIAGRIDLARGRREASGE